MFSVGCVPQDAVGFTVAVRPVQLLQGEEVTADDLLCCVDDPLEHCLFLDSTAGKPH